MPNDRGNRLPMDVLRAYVSVSLLFLVPSLIFLTRLPEAARASDLSPDASQTRVTAHLFDIYPERRYVTPTTEDLRFWHRASQKSSR